MCPAGRGLYRFTLRKILSIAPNVALAETKVADATPGMIAMYATGDEQALPARVRYNRLIDVFMGVTCYSTHQGRRGCDLVHIPTARGLHPIRDAHHTGLPSFRRILGMSKRCPGGHRAGR